MARRLIRTSRSIANKLGTNVAGQERKKLARIESNKDKKTWDRSKQDQLEKELERQRECRQRTESELERRKTARSRKNKSACQTKEN